MWVVFVPFCRLVFLCNRDALNQNDSHIRQSSNVKLFGAQRRMETAKPLQFLELMKETFDCVGNWVENMDNDSVMSDDGESDE
jgi:hypothetical protein